MAWRMEPKLSHCLSIAWLRSSEAVGPWSLHPSPHHPAWTKIFWTQRPVLSTRRSHFRVNEDFWDNALLYRGKKKWHLCLWEKHYKYFGSNQVMCTSRGCCGMIGLEGNETGDVVGGGLGDKVLISLQLSGQIVSCIHLSCGLERCNRSLSVCVLQQNFLLWGMKEERGTLML